MSAIQCCPQLLVQPVTCSFICWSKPGRRSSISLTSHLEKPLVSAMASLQNSVPVQAMAPRQKAETSTCRPMLLSATTSAAVFALGTLTMRMFCMIVVRSSPLPYCSARSASCKQLVAREPPAQNARATEDRPGWRCGVMPMWSR